MTPGRIGPSASPTGRAAAAQVLLVRYPNHDDLTRDPGYLAASVREQVRWNVLQHLRANDQVETIVFESQPAGVALDGLYVWMGDVRLLQVERYDVVEPFSQQQGQETVASAYVEGVASLLWNQFEQVTDASLFALAGSVSAKIDCHISDVFSAFLVACCWYWVRQTRQSVYLLANNLKITVTKPEIGFKVVTLGPFVP